MSKDRHRHRHRHRRKTKGRSRCEVIIYVAIIVLISASVIHCARLTLSQLSALRELQVERLEMYHRLGNMQQTLDGIREEITNND